MYWTFIAEKVLTSGITLKDEVLLLVEVNVQVVATATTLEEVDLLLEVLLVVLVEVDFELDVVELVELLVVLVDDALDVLDVLVDVDVVLEEEEELEPDDRTK